MTLLRPVAVTPELELAPAPTSAGGLSSGLVRVRLRGEVADLDRAELEQLRDAADEALE